MNSQGTMIKHPLTIQTLTASKTELRPHIGSANCMWGSPEVAIVKSLRMCSDQNLIKIQRYNEMWVFLVAVYYMKHDFITPWF